MLRRGVISCLLVGVILITGQFGFAGGLAFLVPEKHGPYGQETNAVLSWLQTVQGYQTVYLDGPERFVDSQGNPISLAQLM
jgi:hypothetical protein